MLVELSMFQIVLTPPQLIRSLIAIVTRPRNLHTPSPRRNDRTIILRSHEIHPLSRRS
jgi:hypothetical protein